MLSPIEIPLTCARLIKVAERDPRRVLPLAQRAFNQTSSDDMLSHAWATYTLGWALLRWERVLESHPHLEEAQGAFTRLGLSVPVLHCRRAQLIGALLGGAGADLQADWETLAADYEAAGLPLDAARVRTQQVAYLNMLGRPRDAMALASEIAPLVRAQGTLDDQARLLRVTAVAYGDMGALDQAAAHLDSATALFTQLRYALEVAKCWVERAWISQRREQFGPALTDLERALAVFRRLDLPLRVAFCEENIGLAASRIGRYDQAIAATLRARTQFVALGRRDQVAGCDLNLGIIAYYSGLYEVALAAYRRAQAVYAELGMRRMSLMCQRNQALALRAWRQPAAAMDLLAALEEPIRALGDRLELAELYTTQAQILRDLRKYDAALACLATAETQFTTAGNMPAAAECLLEQGWLHLDQGNPGAAVAYLDSARERLVDRPTHSWRIDYGLGQCAQLQGDMIVALKHYRAASATVAGLRRTLASEHASSGLFTQAQQLYADALRLAADQDDVAVVLELAEQQRALALQRQITSTAFYLPPDLQLAHEQQRAHLRALVDRDVYDESLDAALLTYTDLLLRVRHNAPLPDHLPTAPLDLIALRAQFGAAYPAGWTVLVYTECDDELLIVALDQHGLALTRTPLDAGLRHLLKRASQPQYRHFTYLDLPLVYGQTRTPWAGLAALAERLLPPAVRARLDPDMRLLIVPSQSLHAVPWAALRVGDAWLCERAVIQLLPALTLWPLLAARSAPSDAALLLGCRYFGERAPDLPNVTAELDLVAAHWSGSVTRMEDTAATRSALLDMARHEELQRYRLLHLACHAQLVSAHGLLAHLKLWDDDLLLDEVGSLGLSGALVVLVACDAAASEVLPGEELLGLSRAFLAAGARDVIASLWPIYDRAIQWLLAPLYDGLAQGQDAPTALAQAQRVMLKQQESGREIAPAAASPIIWGSLSVLGAGTAPGPAAGGTRPASLHAGQTGID